ncbi:hemerythrin domain-containing protein [Ammoniphilus sp. CFH 90114]|uniref:hemerythrin domain-containing protein n=1 Tax=Ammoniphilus sp. CFH 90114 TaxID=2493665 RepID=UPI0013E8FE48|nr:hemerythrin domain-containing protein [Ammoniphilus sp. CFH 90114]
MNITDSFALFLEQHEQIKATAKEAQLALERIKSTGNVEGYQEVLDKLVKLKAELMEHSRQEEEVIVPLVEKMYHSPEMAHYVEDEHVQMEEDLLAIKKQLRMHISEEREQLDEEVFVKTKRFLTQTVTHIFEEESGLFPMLRGYLLQMEK